MTVQRYKKFQYKPNIFRIIFELFLGHFEGRNAQQSNAQLFEMPESAEKGVYYYNIIYIIIYIILIYKYK